MTHAVIDGEEIIPNSNPVFGVEVRGFDHIPEPERNMTLRQVDWFWVGSNANLFFVIVGSLAVTTGLNLWWAVAACIVGNLLYAYVAGASIGAVRVGVPTTTLTRGVFGMRGNFPNALFAWLSSVAFEVINTVLGVFALLALFPLLGWSEPGVTGKLIAVALQLILGGGIAVLGHATMIYLQRIFAVLLSVVLLGVLGFTVGKVDWAAAGTAHAQLSSTTIFAAFLTAASVIASGPISYLYNAPDWVRYLPSATPARKIFGHVFWASYLPSVVLCIMGAMWATLGDMSDPVAGLQPLIPGWLFVAYIIAVVGGSLANNVPTYYSSGLSLQALGLRVHRYVATGIDICVSTLIVIYILFVQDFSTALNDFVALMMAWLGPYAGVWMCDGYLRGWKFDHRALHRTGDPSGRYWGWNGVNLRGWTAMAIGIVVAVLTMKSPVFDGPIATALGGADLNWILGFLVAALAYRLLTPAGSRVALGDVTAM